MVYVSLAVDMSFPPVRGLTIIVTAVRTLASHGVGVIDNGVLPGGEEYVLYTGRDLV
jgi:hypothetical protein